MKLRGIFEKVPGSNIWWIRYADAAGRIRREKVGLKSAALTLYRKRKTEALQGRKLPESLRRRAIGFSELVRDALDYSKAHKRSYEDDISRMKRLQGWFGDRAADSITPQEIESRLTDAGEKEGLAPATLNRYKALFSLIYRLGMENGKVNSNPARWVKHRREDNARLRWLTPEEEGRLREIIRARWPEHLPEFDLALHSGLRRGEMYNLLWEDVDFNGRLLAVRRGKNGEGRYVPMNQTARSALLALRENANASGRIFGIKKPRHWFEPTVREAGVLDFTWHCLRHTFASRLVMAGVDLRTVQELMGHKSIQMTCRYAHLASTHKLAAVERLAGYAEKSQTAWAREAMETALGIRQPDGPGPPSTEGATDTKTSTGQMEILDREAAYVQ